MTEIDMTPLSPVLKKLHKDKAGDKEFQRLVERCIKTACARCSYAMWSRTALPGEREGNPSPSPEEVETYPRIWLFLYCQVTRADMFLDRIFDCDVQRIDAAKRRRRQRKGKAAGQ